MKKKLLAILLVLIMLVGMVPTVAFADGSGTVYIAFTSDVHNGNSSSGFGGSSGSSLASERLDNWLNGVSYSLGGIKFEAMGFCGDNGSGYANGDDYWNYVQEVIDVVDDNDYVENAYFTAGNHEYINGNLGSTTNNTAKKIIVNDGAVDNDSYSIYCLGASQSSEAYTDDNITKLGDYLSKKGSDKPIFILTHFPLHYYGSRTTTNADKVY